MSYSIEYGDLYKEKWEALPDEAKVVVADLQVRLTDNPRALGRPLEGAGSEDLLLFEHEEPGVNVIFRVRESDLQEVGASSNGEGVVTLLHPQLVYFEPPKTVFVVYSRKDKKWKKELEDVLLKPDWGGRFEFWSDADISPGARWEDVIKEKLNSVTAALLLVSRNFLSSEYITEVELRKLLKREKRGGTKILWLRIDDFEVPRKISKIQWLEERTLEKSQKDGDLKDLLQTIVENIRKALDGA